MTPQERMAKAFAALGDDDRRFWLGVLEEVVATTPKSRRPALHLVHGGPLPVAECNQTRTVVHIKNKEA